RSGAGGGRTRRHRPPALRLSLHRPAPPHGDRPASGLPPPDLAARRADLRVGQGFRTALRRTDGRAPARWWHHRGGDALAAGTGGDGGTEDGRLTCGRSTCATCVSPSAPAAER